MKRFRFLLYILLIGTNVWRSFAQESDIFRVIFSEQEPFANVLKSIAKKVPHRILIGSQTEIWNPGYFWIEDISGKPFSEIKDTIPKLDEHHAYRKIYFFADSALDRLVADSEKLRLNNLSLSLAPKHISLVGKNYSTVKGTKNIAGFYVTTVEPVYTRDSTFAFAHIYLFYREEKIDWNPDGLFGEILYVMEKDKIAGWRRLSTKTLFY
jgi:hypothetical protein